jgi:hypothetical protein
MPAPEVTQDFLHSFYADYADIPEEEIQANPAYRLMTQGLIELKENQIQKLQGETNIMSKRYTLERVTSPEVLENEWNPSFVRNFEDENDREPMDLLQERLANGEAFFLLRDAKTNKPVGMEFFQMQLDGDSQPTTVGSIKPAYIPWTAVDAELRNEGLGTQANKAIAQEMRAQHGVQVTYLDIEDPERLIEHDVYGPKGSEESAQFSKDAERRLNYWSRQGFMIVTDERLPYVRPVSDREFEPDNAEHQAERENFIQAWDHMAIRFEDPALRALHVREVDGVPAEINIDFVRESYLAMNLIQYDNPPSDPSMTLEQREDMLCHNHPAIDHYLTQLDTLKAQNVHWLSLRPPAEQKAPKPPLDISWVGSDTAPKLEISQQMGHGISGPFGARSIIDNSERTRTLAGHVDNSERTGILEGRISTPQREVAAGKSLVNLGRFGAAALAVGSLGYLATRDNSSTVPIEDGAKSGTTQQASASDLQRIRDAQRLAATPLAPVQRSVQSEVRNLVSEVFPKGIPADVREMITDIVDGGSSAVNAQAIMNLQEKLATDGLLRTDAVGFRMVAKALEQDGSNMNAQLAVLEMRLTGTYGANPVSGPEDLAGLRELATNLRDVVPDGKFNRLQAVARAITHLENRIGVIHTQNGQVHEAPEARQ